MFIGRGVLSSVDIFKIPHHCVNCRLLANMQYSWRQGPGAPKIVAKCEVGPNGNPCNGASETQNVVSGVVTFEDSGKGCRITYKIGGLTPGQHGFHIHEKADFSNGCISAGPHFNPHKVAHGGPGIIFQRKIINNMLILDLSLR